MILGGANHALGAFVGAGIFEVVKLAASAYMAGVWQLLLGVTLLVVIVVAPDGIIGALEKKKENKQGEQNGGRNDDLFGTNSDFSDRRESQFKKDDNDDEDKFKGFFKSVLPWDLTFAYQLTYTNVNREKKISGNSLMLSANSDITPKWKVGVSTGYDFVQKGITFTQLRFERDLMSWRMDFNWTPFGPSAYWSFFIGIKSGVLSDIKWNKRTTPDKILR